MFDKSVKTQSVQYCRDANHGRNSHFSLKPSPTPVPFSWTDTVASVKLHDAAAKVVIAEERIRSSCKGQRDRCIAKGGEGRKSAHKKMKYQCFRLMLLLPRVPESRIS
jgi:hypothetical protein